MPLILPLLTHGYSAAVGGFTSQFSDNFNRTETLITSSNWTLSYTSVAFADVAACVSGTTLRYTDANPNRRNIHRASTTTLGADQYAEVEYLAMGVASGHVGVGVRLTVGSGLSATTDQGTGYSFWYDIFNTRFELRRLDGTSGNTAIGTTATQAIAANDVMRIEVIGSTISGYVNGGSALVTATDSTYSSGGTAGLDCRIGTASNIDLDNFDCGDQ